MFENKMKTISIEFELFEIVLKLTKILLGIDLLHHNTPKVDKNSRNPPRNFTNINKTSR